MRSKEGVGQPGSHAVDYLKKLSIDQLCCPVLILLNYYLDLFKIIIICMYILLKVGRRLGNSKPLFSLGLHNWLKACCLF